MKLQVKLIRSTIKRVEKQKRIIAALGLRKMNQIKIHNDNPVIRGMIFKVKHLLEVIEIAEPVQIVEQVGVQEVKKAVKQRAKKVVEQEAVQVVEQEAELAIEQVVENDNESDVATIESDVVTEAKE